jgi:hypothetical protein
MEALMFLTSETAHEVARIVDALQAGRLKPPTIPTSCSECGMDDPWDLEREHITFRYDDGTGPRGLLKSVVVMCCEGFIPVRVVGGKWVRRVGDGSD